MICAECGKLIDPKVDEVYNPEFAVCRKCHDETTANWELDKAELRAAGHKIPCDTIVKLSEEFSKNDQQNTNQ